MSEWAGLSLVTDEKVRLRADAVPEFPQVPSSRAGVCTTLLNMDTRLAPLYSMAALGEGDLEAPGSVCVYFYSDHMVWCLLWSPF